MSTVAPVVWLTVYMCKKESEVCMIHLHYAANAKVRWKHLLRRLDVVSDVFTLRDVFSLGTPVTIQKPDM